MEEIVINFDKACRICMRDTVRKLKSIFNDDTENNLTLADLIGICSSNKVVETDGIPCQICSGCELELKNAYNFRKKCDESYKAFHDLLIRQTEEYENEDHIEIKVEDIENKTMTPRMKYKQNVQEVKEETVTYVEEDLEEEIDDPADSSYEVEQLESDEEAEEKREQDENNQPSSTSKKKTRKVRSNIDPKLTEAINEALDEIKRESGVSFELVNDPETNTKYYVCKICEKKFTRQTHVKRHMLTHSSIKPYKCQHCEKSFNRSDHLQKHAILHSNKYNTYTCDICTNKTFSRPESLKNHMKRHYDEPKPKNFVCETCNKGFTTQKYLDTHIQTHSAPKSFTCKFCSEVFEERKDLHQHNKLHINERPYLCSECGQRFLRNDYLVIHMRRHKGEKPYKCRFCEKSFPRATDLTVHERYHTEEKTHLCNTCGKGFHRSYNLKIHERTHSGKFFLILNYLSLHLFHKSCNRNQTTWYDLLRYKI
uniref:CSON009405 protein n=1 Tax=Culicoides sonorensis TaxID=179676 RepID=A0A336M3Y1_CULSO